MMIVYMRVITMFYGVITAKLHVLLFALCCIQLFQMMDDV